MRLAVVVSIPALMMNVASVMTRDEREAVAAFLGIPGGAAAPAPKAIVPIATSGGMLFVNSGYSRFGGTPANVLLAFGPE